jgi:hypothetical protein
MLRLEPEDVEPLQSVGTKTELVGFEISTLRIVYVNHFCRPIQ